MKLSTLAFAVLAAVGSAQSLADTRNPFDPAGAANKPDKSAQSPARQAPPAVPFPMLPPVLPPPLPAPRPGTPMQAAASQDSAPTVEKKKSKESQLESTAAACQLKVKSESIAAPAFGGLVSIPLLGGSKACVSAVMVEQTWLEVQELSDPSAIRIAVDANEGSTPRQSNIIIANTGRSITVTLVQEGRTPRSR